jgi:hypothetical protein
MRYWFGLTLNSIRRSANFYFSQIGARLNGEVILVTDVALAIKELHLKFLLRIFKNLDTEAVSFHLALLSLIKARRSFHYNYKYYLDLFSF